MKPRFVLAIETSTRRGSAALMKAGEAPVERVLEEGAVQGRDLAPGIQSLLAVRNLEPEQLDLVAVGLGPGSYTGLRVGIALGRAFAYAADCEVVGVSSFAALALSAGSGDAEILCVAKAGRDEFYYALFSPPAEEGSPRMMGDHAIGSRAEVARLAAGRRRVLGEGADQFAPGIDEEASSRRPAAGWVARLGLTQFLESGPTPAAELNPLYLRRSKAEINWERREASRKRNG
jgi:tRNA threonylcarbamoyladenosine biosynthesis protein TsaB